MRELPNEMLPLALENEMNKDWTLICDKYWRFKANADTLCRNAKEFPTSRQIKFTSGRTGLEWNLVCTYPVSGRDTSFYYFYTPYTNPKGKKGCYTICEENCERMTPHYFDRVCSRFLHPRGIFPKTLDEMMEAYCRYVADDCSFLFVSHDRHEKYMVLRGGIAIVDVAGNGLVTYITFVNYDMLFSYQTPYKRVVERMHELYRENGNRWDLDRFEQIINEEDMSPDEEGLTQIKTIKHREFTKPPRAMSWQAGRRQRKYDEAMQELGDSAARQWTPVTQRPGTTSWIDPAELQKGVEELLRQRGGGK